MYTNLSKKEKTKKAIEENARKMIELKCKTRGPPTERRKDITKTRSNLGANCKRLQNRSDIPKNKKVEKYCQNENDERNKQGVTYSKLNTARNL